MRYRLGDLCDVKGGKRLPKGVNLCTTPNSHPYIRVRDLGISKTLELSPSYEYVDDDTQKAIARYIVNTDDIIISIVGTIGLVGKIGHTLNNANLTENCAKIVNIQKSDKDFLYYFLTSEIGQNLIKKGTVGAVQAKLPLKNIQDLEIDLPDLATQREIAATLSALDDKIAVNTKLNHNFALSGKRTNAISMRVFGYRTAA
jgi:type I restriction enzyme S subunit